MVNCARGAHEISVDARTVFEARQAIAALFGCPRADHVAFSLNSTEALNIAINGVINPGEHVITTDLEHNSVLRPLHRLERDQQVRLDYIEADRQGKIDYDGFGGLLRPETKAIITTHASNLTGTCSASRYRSFAKAHNLLYIVDASQTAAPFH
jgi:selenocysteine lyase/cysteine desulfurase